MTPYSPGSTVRAHWKTVSALQAYHIKGFILIKIDKLHKSSYICEDREQNLQPTDIFNINDFFHFRTNKLITAFTRKL